MSSLGSLKLEIQPVQTQNHQKFAILDHFWKKRSTGSGQIWPKIPKDTPTGLDLSKCAFIKSPGSLMLEIQPVQTPNHQILDFPLFRPIWPLPVDLIWPKVPKGTPTVRDFNLSPKASFYDFPFKSYSPYKKAMTTWRTDGRTDRQTDRRTPQIYRPQLFLVGA